MADISLLKDLVTPLFAAGVGTAGGALIVNFINDQNLEFKSKSDEIKTCNLLLAECNIQINCLFNYLQDLNNQHSYYLKEKPIAITFCNNQKNPSPQPNFEKFHLDRIYSEEIKLLCKNSQANLICLSSASRYGINIPLINSYEKNLHEFFDKTASLVENSQHEAAIKFFYGIEHNGMTQDFIDPCFSNLINLTKFSILLLDEIQSKIHIEKKEMKRIYENYNFKKLPNLVQLNIDKLKSNSIYPKKEEFNYFESIIDEI